MSSKDMKELHHGSVRSFFHKSFHRSDSEKPAAETSQGKPLPSLPNEGIHQAGPDQPVKDDGAPDVICPPPVKLETQPGKESDPVTSEQLASVKDNDDLWTLAYRRLHASNEKLAADLETYLNGQIDQEHVVSAYEDSLKERDRKQWAVKIFGRNIKIRDQVDRLLKFALWSDKIIKPALSAQPIAQLAWTAVSITLPLLGNATEEHADMLEGYNAVCSTQRLYRFRIDKLRAKGSLPNEVATEIVTLYQKMMEYHAKAICHLASSSVKRAWKGTWKLIDWQGMQTEVEKQNKLCDLFFQDLVGKEARDEVRDLFEEETEQIKRSVQMQDQIRSTLVEMLDVQKDMRHDDKVEQILNRLDSSHSVGESSYSISKNRCRTRVEGTGEWFSTHGNFQRFRDAKNPCLLWLFGEPGTGKTNVMTTTVCYFFFHDDLKEQGGTSALKAFIHQILTSPPTAQLASKLAERTRFPTALSELWSTLVELAHDKNAGEIICVLDALDECEYSSRKELTDLVVSYYNHIDTDAEDAARLKFLVTSRPILELENRVISDLQDCQAFSHIDSRSNAALIARDINIFIKHEIPRFYPKWEQSERDQLIEYLQSMENKTYLWLRLIFDLMYRALPEYQNLTTAKEEMAKVPSTVADAYEEMLQKASSKSYARSILEVVLAAQRPLTVDEVNVAFSILRSAVTHRSLDDLRLNLYDPGEFQNSVKEICGFFVEIYDSKVYFIHQTARQFLLAESSRKRKVKESEWQHSFDPEAFNGSLSRCCLDFLLLWEEFRREDEGNAALGLDIEDDNLDKTLSSRDGPRDKALQSFLQYASEYWPVDLHQSSQEHQISLLEKAFTVCETSNIARDSVHSWWFQVYVDSLFVLLRERLGVLNPELWTAFGVACVVGSAEVAEYCLKRSEAPGGLMESEVADVGTSFEIAITFDQENIAELLLKQGASIEKSEADESSLLAQAVNGENIRIVELLISHGADPNETWQAGLDEDERNHCLPFIAAAGSLDLLRRVLKLCDGRLDPRWATEALAGAIMSRDSTIQRLDLLVKAGAEVNSDELEQGYVLACAAEADNLPALKHLLLKLKADIAKQGPSALCAAASEGNLKISKMLVEKLKVDVNAEVQNSGYESIQEAAAWGGNTELFRLVTNQSTDWTVCGEEALRAAAIAGHLSIAKILVEELHVDINTDNQESSESAVSAAARSGKVDVLTYLLGRGAQMQGDAKEILERAVFNGQIEAVRVLLQDAHVDPNYEMNSLFINSILGSAAYSANPDMVQILIDNGVDLDAYGAPALASALGYNMFSNEAGRLETIQKLLEHGVSPNAVVENRSMLQHAAASCDRNAIAVLIEHEANLARFGPKAICAAIQSPVQYKLTEEAIRKTVKRILGSGVRKGAVDSEEELEIAVIYAAAEGYPDVLQELWRQNSPEDDTLLKALSRALMMRASVHLVFDRPGAVPNENVSELSWRQNRRYDMTIDILIEEMKARRIFQQASFIGTDGIARPYKEGKDLGRYWLRALAGGKYFDEVYIAHLELPSQEHKELVMLTYNKIVLVRTNELQTEWETSFTQIKQISKERTGLNIVLKGEANEHFITIEDEDSKKWLYREIAVAVNSYNKQSNAEARAEREEREMLPAQNERSG